MAQTEIILDGEQFRACMLLRESDLGYTKAEFIRRAKILGIENPMICFEKLVKLGLARVQDRSEEGRENRLKATHKAFSRISMASEE